MGTFVSVVSVVFEYLNHSDSLQQSHNQRTIACGFAALLAESLRLSVSISSSLRLRLGRQSR